MLNDKELLILNQIYQCKRPVHIDELALNHKLSPRSIRSYIARINKDFQFECIRLQKGSYQMTDPGFLEEFFKNYQVSNYSGQVLVVFMLHKLILENKINLSHFVIEFEVSRTTAKNYLNQVKEQLEEYHLKLDHSAGITLLGKESDKRQLILNLLLQFPQRDPIERQLVSPLLEHYQDKEVGVILKDFLKNLLAQLDYTLSQHSHQVLLSYLSIALCRHRQGFPLEDIINRAFLQNSSEYEKTSVLFQNLQERLQVTFPLEEILEIINKIMGLHYSTDKEAEHHNWFEYDLFISKMIRRFSKECGYNLVGDFELYENLLNHIKPAMYRIAHQIKLHQFDFQYIIDSSPKEYAITQEILSKLHFFPSEKGMAQYQDEIALICVYFKQALEKEKTKTAQNVLLISNYGYGSSRMMMERIRQLYQVGEIQWIPSHELPHIDQTQFHLVVSTHIQEDIDKSLPVIHITPFFHQEDRHKLSHFLALKEVEKVNLSEILAVIESHKEDLDQSAIAMELLQKFPTFLQDDRQNSSGILDFMSEENILLDVSADNIQQVLFMAGKLLENHGYITESYTSDLIQSFENYGIYMMIDKDVAIPHTKNRENVLKTGFTFLRLKKPILFDQHELSMFFTFCTRNNKEHLEALILIADIIKQESTKKSMQNLKTPEEILNFLALSDKTAE